MKPEEVDCKKCKGAGKVRRDTCKTCGGNGRVLKSVNAAGEASITRLDGTVAR